MVGLGIAPPSQRNLPRPEDFSRALYTIDIGQNDIASGLEHTNEEKVLASIPDILAIWSGVVHVSVYIQLVSSMSITCLDKFVFKKIGTDMVSESSTCCQSQKGTQ